MNSQNNKFIAFVGSPNCGKSTIFNALTGLRQKIANYPGVTIEPKIGETTIDKHKIQLIDLPGIYSFSPKRPDEELTATVLQGKHPQIAKPSSAFFVLEGVNLEKGLFLFSQYAKLEIPTVVIVTMIDEIQANGGALDDIGLERALGVPVIGVVGHKGIGFDEVRSYLKSPEKFVLPKDLQLADESIETGYNWARDVSHRVANIPEQDALTRKLDSVFLHPVIGPLVFVLVMALFFQSIFTWAAPLMDGISDMIAGAQKLVEQSVPDGIVQSFIAKGVLAGVGSVIAFLPQILILYFFITLLEDFGYLARAAFLIDRLMGVFGLQGRSFIPLLGSFACAIPGIMSARIIPTEKDRLATILIAPLMTCSARLPVYVLLISAFVPAKMLGGFLNLQAAVLFGLYILAAFSGLVVAKIFKSTILRGSILPFLMELPPYRFPAWKNIGLTMIGRLKTFFREAGTTILAISLILWACSEFPRATIPAGATKIEAQHIQLENSALGTIGKTIEPLFAPIGFDWKTTVGVLGSFAAREVFISVMGQMYSADVSESDEHLRSVLQRSITLPSALAILAFYVYALQCMSTIAVMKRETGSWKYPAFAFCYTFILAYSAAYLTNFIALRF